MEGEYTSGEVQSFLKDKGVVHEMTTADTPQHNGVAERMNCTHVACSSTPSSPTPIGETLSSTPHCIPPQCSPTRSLEDSIPEEAQNGNRPDVSCLRISGCRTFVHISDKMRHKLSAKSLVCTFIGYAKQCKAYRLDHRPSGRFFESRNVIFDEGGTGNSSERIIIDANDAAPPSVNPTSPSPSSGPTPSPPSTTLTPVTTNVQIATIAPRPKRTTRPPIRDDDLRYSVILRSDALHRTCKGHIHG